MLSACVFCSSYHHVCVASNFRILVRAATGVTSVVHIYLHSSRVHYGKMPVHWLSPFSELLLDSVQLCMLKVKIKIEYWHWKNKTLTLLRSLYIMASWLLQAYVVITAAQLLCMWCRAFTWKVTWQRDHFHFLKQTNGARWQKMVYCLVCNFINKAAKCTEIPSFFNILDLYFGEHTALGCEEIVMLLWKNEWPSNIPVIMMLMLVCGVVCALY